MIKSEMSDKKKRNIRELSNRGILMMMYLFVPTLLYLSLTLYFYYNEKHNIESEANRYFVMESPYWADSITCMNDINMFYYPLNTEWYKVERCMQHRVIQDYHGSCTIPGKYIHEKNYLYFFMRQNNLHLVSSGRYDIAVADSLWKESLWRNGLKVETSLIMNKGELRDMFPTKDSLNEAFTLVSDTSRIIDFDAAYRTDTSFVSFRNLISIVGFVDVPSSLIFERISSLLIFFTLVFVTYILFILMKGIVWIYMRNSDKVHFLGNAFVLGKNRILVYADGSARRIGANELLVLQMLAKNNGRSVAISDIEALCWKGYADESAQKNFNSLFSSLLKNVAAVAHVSLKREKNDVVYVENTNFVDRIMREMRMIVYLLKNWNRI
jgi:hypothetical protein